MITIPKEIQNIIKTINNAGSEAYLVGGFVRDALLGIETHDIDIASNATVSQLKKLFNTHHEDAYGDRFGLMKLNSPQYSIEITHYRKESGYEDLRHPKHISFVQSIKEDAHRRDFTINALYYHPTQGIFDFFGGLNDLESKVLRCIGDPEARFTEDALRILRLFRFSSELGFTVEDKTREAALKNLNLLKKLKPIQTYKEISKLIMAPNILEVSMAYPEVFSALIPELGEALNFDQENPYHRYSLYEHTMRVLDACPMNLPIRLAALFHDLGKLETRTRDEKGISHFRHHARESMNMAKPYLDGYGLSQKDKNNILKLIDLHDYKLKATTASIYDFLSQHSFEFVDDLIQLKRADNLAKSDLAGYQVDKCNQFEVILKDIKYRNLPLSVRDLSVYPKDLMHLGIEGKDISKALNLIYLEVKKLELGNDRQAQLKLLERVVERGIY